MSAAALAPYFSFRRGHSSPAAGYAGDLLPATSRLVQRHDARGQSGFLSVRGSP